MSTYCKNSFPLRTARVNASQILPKRERLQTQFFHFFFVALNVITEEAPQLKVLEVNERSSLFYQFTCTLNDRQNCTMLLKQYKGVFAFTSAIPSLMNICIMRTFHPFCDEMCYLISISLKWFLFAYFRDAEKAEKVDENGLRFFYSSVCVRTRTISWTVLICCWTDKMNYSLRRVDKFYSQTRSINHFILQLFSVLLSIYSSLSQKSHS